VEGEPVQVIASAPITLSEVDLRQLPDAERKAEEQRLTTEATRPSLTWHRPLLRQLLHLAPEEYMLLFTMHHIVADGWSIGFSSENWQHFTRLSTGKSSPP